MRGVYDEARDSRQDARDFRARALHQLTDPANRVESSPNRLEATMTVTLGHHSAEMTRLKHDLHFFHSQQTSEILAKLEMNEGVVLNVFRIKVYRSSDWSHRQARSCADRLRGERSVGESFASDQRMREEILFQELVFRKNIIPKNGSPCLRRSL